MSTATSPPEHELFESEYENEPVPLARRRSLLSVTAIWAGFPMIITAAVTGATLVHGLGFARGVVAMVIGNLLLFAYVGLLSANAARTGLNFALQAARTFGSTGSIVCSALLSTLVIGWFAVQTGLVGQSMATAFDVNLVAVTLLAGVLFTAVTLMGIRALSVIGMISVPLFLVLGVYAAVTAIRDGGAVWSYAGDPAAGLALGVGVTLVFALFADSGTLTADFTRWSRNRREAVLATASAFPVANLVAMLVGGTVAAAAGGAGDVFGIIAEQGGVLAAVAVVFLFVNLGSVCTHCLYNGAVGWSSILGSRMRVLTVVLGVVGILAAVLGIWNVFISWLNLLGVIVPPIGAVMIVDHLVRRDRTPRSVRWQPFAAWVIASGVALVVSIWAPQLSTVVTGLLVAALAYWAITAATDGRAAAATTPDVDVRAADRVSAR